MPELPDITIYIEQLLARIGGEELETIRVANPFLVRTWDPALESAHGKRILTIRRMGKRIVFGLEGDLFLLLHLMIAGRLHWRDAGARLPAKNGLASFVFGSGTLILTEAGTRKRASLCLVRGEEGVKQYDPGGLEVLDANLGAFHKALLRENHTLKRSLTDPRIFSGIGNAYSDEILHRARLSPLKRTGQLDDAEIGRLYDAVLQTLRFWTDRLRRETGAGFPEKVTAFRKGMAVHGRHKQPCPECGAPVQRITYAESETNYCPNCQTGGKLLADRALSRLLRDDWPRSLDALEELKRAGRKRRMTKEPATTAAKNPTMRFSNRVDYYVRYRPGYPEAIISCLCLETGLAEEWLVADIGSGTGILSEMFLKLGNFVYCIEPNDEMRAVAESRLDAHAGYVSMAATAEATTLPPSSIDLIVAGQAFHWFDREKARAEFLRILKPGGWIALLWNTRKTDTSAFMQEYERLLRSYGTDYLEVDHRNVTPDSLQQFHQGFQKRSFPNEQVFDFEGLRGRLLSSSYAPLPGAANFNPMMEELSRIFSVHQRAGKVRFDYETELYFAQLR